MFNRCRSCKYSKSVSWEFVILQFKDFFQFKHHFIIHHFLYLYDTYHINSINIYFLFSLDSIVVPIHPR